MVLVMPIVLLVIVVISTTATEKIMVDENGFAVVDLVDKRQEGVVMTKESMETYYGYYREEYGMVNATEFINSIVVPEGMEVQPYKVYGEIDVDETQLYYGTWKSGDYIYQ